MATESDNVNSGALGTLVAVGTIAFFGIALVVTALVRAEMNEELEKKEVSADRVYKDLVAEQTAKLAAPASYVDKGKGLVSLPIDRAMELTVSGLKKDPNSATPPAPVGGSGGAGGADAAAGGVGGTGGAGGVGGVGGAELKPANEATGAEPVPSNEGKPAEETSAKPEEKKDEKKDAKEKKKAPAPKPAVPAAPVPAPAPAAPAPAPNGQ